MTVVGYGGGTDSTAMLVGLWQRQVPVDLILFADPGGEQPHTYEYLEIMERWLLEHGAKRVTLLGALGGARMEHTLANIATGLYLARNGAEVCIADERSELHYLLPGRPLRLPRGDWMYLSLFPIDGSLTGVSMSGVFYPLSDATLTPDYPLGVSNEFTADAAELSCTGGNGLVVLTRADG